MRGVFQHDASLTYLYRTSVAMVGSVAWYEWLRRGPLGCTHDTPYYAAGSRAVRPSRGEALWRDSQTPPTSRRRRISTAAAARTVSPSRTCGFATFTRTASTRGCSSSIAAAILSATVSVRLTGVPPTISLACR